MPKIEPKKQVLWYFVASEQPGGTEGEALGENWSCAQSRPQTGAMLELACPKHMPKDAFLSSLDSLILKSKTQREAESGEVRYKSSGDYPIEEIARSLRVLRNRVVNVPGDTLDVW